MRNRVPGIGLIAIIFVSLLILSVSSWANADKGEWIAPASANKLKNPTKGDAEAVEKGEELYGQMCAICHGDEGEGDGIAGMSLNPAPADLTSDKVQGQSDGAIFWKMTEGRTPMASYKSTLSDEQRWQLVNFIKTLNE